MNPLQTAQSTVSARAANDPTIVRASDGLAYKYKSTARDFVTEYLCAGAALLHGVPVPAFRVLHDNQTDEYGIGWLWDEARSLDAEPDLRGLVSGEAGKSLSRGLSKILVLDLYFHVTDRHLGNLLLRHSPFGPQVMAIDYSSASLIRVLQNPALLLDQYTNTIMVATTLLKQVGFDHEAASEVLQSLASVDMTCILQFYVQTMHPAAMQAISQFADYKQYFDRVMAGDEDVLSYRALRIAAIRKALIHYHQTGRWRGGEMFSVPSLDISQ